MHATRVGALRAEGRRGDYISLALPVAGTEVGDARDTATPPRRPAFCLVLESNSDVRTLSGLADRYELTVLTRSPPITEFGLPEGKRIRVIEGPGSRLRYLPWVVRHLRGGPYDAVLSHNFGVATLAASIAARFTGTPTAALVGNPMEAIYRRRRQANDPAMPFRRHELYALLAVARLNARLARKWLVISDYLAGVLRGYGTRAPIEFVPIYGVDTSYFVPARRSKQQIREEAGLPTDGQMVLFSSRVGHEKDADTLLRAVRRLRDEGRSIWLLNRSRAFEALREAARGHGIGDCVIASDMMDPRSGLVLDYQASDVCVQASHAEGLGFSPLEALACGVPVVATHVGGLRETIVEGETGYTYAPGDVAGLAAQIARALDDPDEAARLSTRGRQMVHERFEADAAFAALDRAMGLASVTGPADAVDAA